MIRDLDYGEYGKPNWGTIAFAKDEEMRPLQACDMLAGSFRHGFMTNEVLPETHILVKGLDGFGENYSGEEISGFGRELREVSDRRALVSPDRTLRGYDPETAARDRKWVRKQRPKGG